MAVSVFDLFRIGIGPSSSHTVGPMRAARLFGLRLAHDGLLPRATRVQSQLYGSLGATGKGHGSDKAVMLGLSGHEPDTVDVDRVPQLLARMRAQGRLALLGQREIAFAEKDDLKFHRRETLPFHANGMRFVAKRLIEYGFHAPALSFPVPGTLMIEPTESEPLVELDRFIAAMIAIRAEIAQVESGAWPRDDNPLKHAPHTAHALTGAEWPHPYSREQAAYPLPALRRQKYWSPVAGSTTFMATGTCSAAACR